jgi:Uma2 family endonuclease
MVQTPVKIMTLAEFLLLPETKPASEFIDGQIIQKPMPQGKHSLIQIELGSNINTAFKHAPVGGASQNEHQSTQVFDEAIDLLPVPEFAKDFQLTLGELFGWLRE